MAHCHQSPEVPGPDNPCNLPAYLSRYQAPVAEAELYPDSVLDAPVHRLHGPLLHYPDDLRFRGVEGLVVIGVVVSPTGSVIDAHPMVVSDLGFVPPAMAK